MCTRADIGRRGIPDRWASAQPIRRKRTFSLSTRRAPSRSASRAAIVAEARSGGSTSENFSPRTARWSAAGCSRAGSPERTVSRAPRHRSAVRSGRSGIPKSSGRCLAAMVDIEAASVALARYPAQVHHRAVMGVAWTIVASEPTVPPARESRSSTSRAAARRVSSTGGVPAGRSARCRAGPDAVGPGPAPPSTSMAPRDRRPATTARCRVRLRRSGELG